MTSKSSLELPDHRFATERSRFLARSTELRLKEAKAVAYSEQGMAWAWIARAMARYGLEILHTLLSEQLADDSTTPRYDPVGPDYLDRIIEKEHEGWLSYVERHSDRLPVEWVNDILEEARDRGYQVSTTTK